MMQHHGVDLAEIAVVFHHENAAGRTRLALECCAGWLPGLRHNFFHHDANYKPESMAGHIRCFTHAGFSSPPVRFL
jgi:hypothetical protein